MSRLWTDQELSEFTRILGTFKAMVQFGAEMIHETNTGHMDRDEAEAMIRPVFQHMLSLIDTLENLPKTEEIVDKLHVIKGNIQHFLGNH